MAFQYLTNIPLDLAGHLPQDGGLARLHGDAVEQHPAPVLQHPADDARLAESVEANHGRSLYSGATLVREGEEAAGGGLWGGRSRPRWG